MTRFSRTNGKATKLNKPFTGGTFAFIARKAGKMTAKNIANVLHRPVTQVYTAARKMGLSLSVHG